MEKLIAVRIVDTVDGTAVQGFTARQKNRRLAWHFAGKNMTKEEVQERVAEAEAKRTNGQGK